MSVMPINNEVFEKVAEAVTFNKNNYGSKLFGYSWDEVKIMVTKWAELNDLSYSLRYNEAISNITLKLSDFKKVEKISNIQLLKYLECINNNIELEKPNHIQSYYIKELEIIISSLKNTIIQGLTEYQEASWSR